MKKVYLAGRGLASTLGPDLAQALVTLDQGGTPPTPFELPGGFSWPVHMIRENAASWTDLARCITVRVAQESGALSGPRTGPLFLATSSTDIGAREDHDDFHGDFQTFAQDIASWLDWQGPAFTVSSACTSGLNALLSARALIRHGHADHALVLGLELRNRVTVAGFGGMQLLSEGLALPFGEHRSGLVLGEAVAALYLSSHASRWRLAGGANVVDGRNPAGIVPNALQMMLQQTLQCSGLQASDIGLIKPQAAGSPVNDAVEAAGLLQAFDPLPPLLSLKAAIGHTLGASGVAEVALLMACLESGVCPRIDYPQDPALNACLTDQLPQHARYVLAQILGFGGGHAAVVLEDTQA
jgi:3-oxoacyl-[acyl-carrier-protein] synthase I